MHQNYTNRYQDIDPDNVENERSVMFQANLNNYDSSVSVDQIMDALQDLRYIKTYKIQIQTRKGGDKPIQGDVVQRMKEDSRYNSYRDNQFLMSILKPKTLKDHVPNQMNEQDDDDDDFKQKEKRGKEKMTNESAALFLQEFMSLYLLMQNNVDCFNSIDLSKYRSSLFQQKIPTNEDNNQSVTITFKSTRQYMEQKAKEKDLQVRVDQRTLYLKNDTVKQCDENFEKEFNIKLNKKSNPMKSFQLGVLQHNGQQLVFQKYFDTSLIQEAVGLLGMGKKDFTNTLFFYREENKYHKRVELLMSCWNSYYVRLDVQFEYCQFAHMEENESEQVLYIKLLTPPYFQMSPYDSSKYELPRLKDDWLRIHNFILDGLMQSGTIDHLQRLHLINNTVVRIVLEKNSDSLIYQLISRMQQFKLFSSVEMDIDYSPKDPPYFFDFPSVTYVDLFKSSLPYSIKYNLLALLSANKFNMESDIEGGFADLCQFIAKEEQKFKKDNNSTKHFETIMEATIQSFMQVQPNLNSDVDYIKLINSGWRLFKKIMLRTIDELLDLPKDEQQKLAFIRRLSLTPSGFLYDLKEPEMTNKVLRIFSDKQDYFTRIHFEDENLSMMKNTQFICEHYFKSKMIDGVQIFDRKYELLTWSSSQLRAGSCWFYDSTSAGLSRNALISSLGSFKGIRPVAKYAARLGQLFSSSMRFELPVKIIPQIDNDEDEARKHLKFTDGIGMISLDLINLLRRQINPSVSAIQIRYGGAKGVLTLNHNLPDQTIVLRRSMVKFSPKDGQYDQELDILDYNKYRGGYLNRQIIMLLQTLGVPDTPFLELQEEYMVSLEDTAMIDASLYKYFNVDFNGQYQGLPNIVTTIQNMLNAGIDPNKNIFVKGVLSRLRTRGYLLLRTKANILVKKAARLIGIVDEYDILEENEVYCSYSIDNSTKTDPEYVRGVGDHQFVFVTRNPCLHPGDIKKLRAVTPEEVMQRYRAKGNQEQNILKDFVNCVVFPKKGELAITAQLAGGDLDGDLYFICWDERLIPPEQHEAFVYDEKKIEKGSFRQRNQVCQIEDYSTQEQLEFMLQYLSSETLGRIDNSHLAFAEKNPEQAKYSKCMRLSELHSKAVDYVKTGEAVKVDSKLLAKEWPDYMEKENKLLEFEGQTALGQLYRAAKKRISNNKDQQPNWYIGNNQKNLPPIQESMIVGYGQLQRSLIGMEQVVTESKQKKDKGEREDQDKVQGEDQDQGEGETQFITSEQDIPQINNQEISSFLKQNYWPHIDVVCQVIEKAFYRLSGIMTLYDINDEFEVYSGNISSLVRGDQIHKKQKYNVENIQKRLIQQLVEFRHTIHAALFKNCQPEDQLIRVSLMHLILTHSQASHVYHKDSLLAQFLFLLFDRINPILQAKLTGYIRWYRGFTWFLFSDELLRIQRSEISQIEASKNQLNPDPPNQQEQQSQQYTLKNQNDDDLEEI